MKKIVLMLVAAVLLMNLCACGKEEPAPTAVDEQINVTPKVEATTAMEETIPFEPPVTEEPAEVEAERVMQEKKALAESCIDKDVRYLYELIGKPNSSDYAPSCLVQGGEDGMLYYDGFVVYTTREGDVETVYYVE